MTRADPKSSSSTATVVLYGVRLIGAIYVSLALIGFVPSDTLNPLHPDGVGVRYLLNLIAIDPIHNLVHLAIGVSALWAARDEQLARRWGLSVGTALIALFVVGMAQAALEGFPPDQLLVVVALNSPGHTLHLVTGGIAVYLGLLRTPRDR